MQLYSILRACCIAAVNVHTRLLLMMLSACVYHCFVIAEVFLNNNYLLYPPLLENTVGKTRSVASPTAPIILNVIAGKTFRMNAFMRRFLRVVVSLLAIPLVPITYLLSIRRTRVCPPPTNPILFKSATALAEMIRNKQIKSEEVVAAYIERCKEVNSYVNAVVEPRYEAALEEARRVDRMLAACARAPADLRAEYPLLGLPITVKESIAVQGMSNDCGTVYEYRNPAKRDAEIVRAARAAGAIPLAVTATPQLCMNWETFNNVTGLTTNPYDQRRTAGGSSGGECALIAAAGSLMGVGSDIAGSLRLPPMFTGIFGHKPSPRLLSVDGHVPDCLDPTFEDYFSLGPIARYAEDLALLLKVLKQPASPHIPDDPVDVSKLKFYYMEGDGSDVSDRIGADVKRAMDCARAHIQTTYNVQVNPLKIQNIEHMWEISIRVLMNIRHVQNIYTDPENRERWVSVWPEIFKKVVGLSKHNFLCVCYGPLQKFFDALPDSYYNNLMTTFDEIKTEFNTALTADAVLLHPAYPAPAHLHYRVYYKFLNCGYLTIFNALGLPVTACPIGMSREGLPVGIQIAANKGNDHLTIAVAKEFEKAFGGWVPPNKHLDSVKTA